MLSRHNYRGITWVDLESPTPSEVRQVMGEFNIHPLVGEELLTPSFKPKVDRYDQSLYLILHFPTFGSRFSGATQEVDFVLGQNFVITTRYGSMDPFLRFSKIFEANSLLDRTDIGVHAGFVFIYMLRNLYRELDQELESLSLDMRRIEERIFAGQEREMVFELSRVSRAFLNFRQCLSPHGSVLESLETIGARIYGQDFVYSLKSVLSDYYRITNGLMSQRDALLELRDTNNSLLSTKQNETSKHLTMMAFVTFPLALLTSVFGMETTYLPIVGRPGDFWIIIGMMSLITIGFFFFFKYKKWL